LDGFAQEVTVFALWCSQQVKTSKSVDQCSAFRFLPRDAAIC